jgi:methylated-DNA-protein-cysteine methyltransferase related protein
MFKDADFFEKVYKITCTIPFGRVTTYGAIARCIGSPGASRMVGWALNNCHSQPEYIPAHRVVNRNGLLTGKHHFRHPGLMQELLENEGIKVIDDRVIDFKSLFWEPSIE